VAVGDDLIHDTLLRAARNDATGKYDFTPFYSEVRDAIESADVAFVNQETPIAGERFGYSGYPRFNGPTAIGDALIATGFDVVNQATNHTMDKGAAAVHAETAYWAKHPKIAVLGIFDSQKERDTKKTIVKAKGVRIGFLAYTYGLNGLRLPASEPYLVALIDKAVIAREVDELRPLCDVLVVSMHWGIEYRFSPSAEQVSLARFLAKHNVDLVIGHHPHVLEPVRRYAKADGGSMLCYFSLGNFVSGQSERARLLGGMMRVVITRDDAGRWGLRNAELVPLVTHYDAGFQHVKVYFLDSYPASLARRHGLYRPRGVFLLAYFANLISTIFGAPTPVVD
jgi:poly-gamma-glutamate synthesis protein (capsule biosynthesis protein)